MYPAALSRHLQGADHYGRFDLAAFHLLVAPLTSEQLQRAKQQSPACVLQAVLSGGFVLGIWCHVYEIYLCIYIYMI